MYAEDQAVATVDQATANYREVVLEFAAPVAFVPEPASGMMLAAIEQQRKHGIADPSVQFAFIIGAKPSDKAAGFEYVVEPVMQASQNDALATLRAQIAPRLALPAA